MNVHTLPPSRRIDDEDRSSGAFHETEACVAEEVVVEDLGTKRRLCAICGAGMARRARQAVILVAGILVLVVGVAGIVLPAVPAVVLLPAGLAILSVEFVWARKLMVRLQTHLKKARDRCRKKGRA